MKLALVKTILVVVGVVAAVGVVVLPTVESGTRSLSTSAAPVYAQVPEIEVARGWVVALNSGDTQAALALLSDDAVLIVEPAQPDAETAIYTGKDEIGAALRRWAADNFHTELLGTPEVVNGTTSWMERQSSDSLRRSGTTSLDVRADALIDTGKIRSLVYEPLSASEGEDTTPTPLPMPAATATLTVTATATGPATSPAGASVTPTPVGGGRVIPTQAPAPTATQVTPSTPSPVPPQAVLGGPTGMPRAGDRKDPWVLGGLLALSGLLLFAGSFTLLGSLVKGGPKE